MTKWFGRLKRMKALGKAFGQCMAEHPEAWALGNQLADELFNSRSDYLIDQTRTKEGQERYIRMASEGLVTAVLERSFEEEAGVPFPEPPTQEAATCFGVALGTRLTDLFEAT